MSARWIAAWDAWALKECVVNGVEVEPAREADEGPQAKGEGPAARGNRHTRGHSAGFEQCARTHGWQLGDAVSDRTGDVISLGRDHPADDSSKVLGNAEGVVRRVAQPAHLGTAVLGADALGAILDDKEVVLLGDSQHFVHVTGLAVEVGGDDGSGLRGDAEFEQHRVDRVRVLAHLDEIGSEVLLGDGCWNAVVREGRHRDLGALLDPKGIEQVRQPKPRRWHHDGMRGSDVLSKPGLEALYEVRVSCRPGDGFQARGKLAAGEGGLESRGLLQHGR